MATGKPALMKKIYEDLDLHGEQRDTAKDVVDTFLQEISDALTKGEDVSLIGFGQFSVVTTKERQGRNPRTGEPVTIASMRRVKFKAGQDLARQVDPSRFGD